MKKYLIPVLLFVFMFSVVEDADAQRKRRRSRDKDDTENTRRSRRDAEEESTVKFTDRLMYDVNIGNISLANSIFGFSIKPGVGYVVNKRLATGLGLKYFYNLDGRYNPDLHLNDIGGYAFAKFNITEAIYLQAEYSVLSFDADYKEYPGGFQYGFEGKRQNFNYPLIGGGYASGFGNWRSGLQVLYIFNETVREIGTYPVEFWFGLTRNF